MPFSLKCPECAARLNVETRLAGRKVKCPQCKKPIEIPETLQNVVHVAEARLTAEPQRAAEKPTAMVNPPPLNGSAESSRIKRKGWSTALLLGVAGVVCFAGGLGWFLWGDTTSSDTREKAPSASTDGSTATDPAIAAAPASPSQGTLIDTSGWIALPERRRDVMVRFPTKPAPFDMLEETTDPAARELGEAALKEMNPTALRSIFQGRKFSFTIANYDLGGVPVGDYLNRAQSMAHLLNPGYSKIEEHAPGEPARDVLLRSDKATRVLRIAHDGQRVVNMVVEGPLDMSYEDPLAQAFLSTLQVGGKAIMPKPTVGAPAPVTTPRPKALVDSEMDPNVPIRLLNPQRPDRSHAMTGLNRNFKVVFPGMRVDQITIEKLLPPTPQRDLILAQLKANTTGPVSVMHLNQRSQRFLVIGFEVQTDGLEWYEVGARVNATMAPIEQLFMGGQGNAWQSIESSNERKGWFVQGVKGKLGDRFVLREIKTCGQFGFLFQIDSDEELALSAPVADQFFHQFVLPSTATTWE